jgi:predicted enzyme involved in methoxymalonyl-ACP biosynthesis
MDRILAVLVCAAALFGEMKMCAAETVCTHKDMQTLAEQLNRGANLQTTIERLEALGADYMVFVGDQRVSLERLKRNGGGVDQPIRILVRSNEKASSNFLVTEDEILTLTFDSKVNLGDWYCHKIYTGP